MAGGSPVTRHRKVTNGPSRRSSTRLLVQGRWFGQAPDIDGHVVLTDGSAEPGDLVRARVTDAADYDLAASLDPEAREAEARARTG